jgi:hypothetical protein
MHTPQGLRLDELYLTLEWYIVSYFSSGTVTKNHVTNLRMLRLCKIRRHYAAILPSSEARACCETDTRSSRPPTRAQREDVNPAPFD